MANHTLLLLLFAIAASSSWSVGVAAIVCPPNDAYSPCGCGEIDFTGTIYLNCGGQQLDDLRVSKILDIFLNSAIVGSISPLKYIYLWKNQLTHVPIQIRHFPQQLVVVDLSNNNITSIDDDAFNTALMPQSVILQNNLLTTIVPGAFKGIFCWMQ
jgi:Leucine-rich repeat (LRR) protein